MLCDESATLEDRHIMNEFTEKNRKKREIIIIIFCWMNVLEVMQSMKMMMRRNTLPMTCPLTQRVMPFLPLQFSVPYMAVVILIITQR